MFKGSKKRDFFKEEREINYIGVNVVYRGRN